MQPKSITLALLFAGMSQAANASNIAEVCSPVITPDKTALSDNIALDLAYYGNVNAANYEEQKKNASLSLVGSALSGSLDYADFAKRRQEISQSVKRDTKIDVRKDLLIYSIGPEKTAAYSDCVKKLANRPVSIYIENVSPTTAVVNFSRQQDGKSTKADVDLAVVGGRILDGSGNLVSKIDVALVGGGSSVYVVKRNPGEELLVVANLKDSESGVTANDYASVPKYVSVNISKVDMPPLELTSQPKCGGGAGCGYTSGPFTASAFTTLVAPSDVQLDYKAVNASFDVHLENCGSVEPSVQYGTMNEHMIEFKPSFKLVGSDQCSRTVAVHVTVPAYKLRYEATFE